MEELCLPKVHAEGQIPSLIIFEAGGFGKQWGSESKKKKSACHAGDPDSIPGSGRFPGEGNGIPLQYSSLENPMDKGAWRAKVHGVTKSQQD